MQATEVNGTASNWEASAQQMKQSTNNQSGANQN
jgi:hypothetical protein